MSLFTTDLQEYSTLAHQVLRDSDPPRIIDAICFFGQTQENDRNALQATAKRWKKHRCHILVSACERIKKGDFIVRGSKAWKTDLVSYGVDSDAIKIYQMSDKIPPSTDAEALGMIPVIKEHSWKRLVITAPPLHAMRVFISLVSACLKNGLDDVMIWSAPCNALAWNDDVFHSGSMPSTTRTNHIIGEFTKIMTYCIKGDYLTAREILEYLSRRETT